MSEVNVISTDSGFEEYINNNERNLVVLHFGADWAPQCKQINDILKEFGRSLINYSFAYIEAEKLPKISVKYNITAVPTLLFIKRNKVLKVIKGGNPRDILEAVKSVSNEPNTSTEELDQQLKRLINSSTVMVFMKGSPDDPKCGFSRKLIQILTECDAVYKTFDILTNQEIREGLKKYSNWPTYPQLYVNGELVGGLDIVEELHKSGELSKLLNDAVKNSKVILVDRLKKLINMDKIVLFMKGSPDSPKCGFSRKTVEILNNLNLKFSHFDILTDDSVRQGLKEYSKWPTYPQLYSNGELLGGYDIIREMDESKELASALSS